MKEPRNKKITIILSVSAVFVLSAAIVVGSCFLNSEFRSAVMSVFSPVKKPPLTVSSFEETPSVADESSEQSVMSDESTEQSVTSEESSETISAESSSATSQEASSSEVIVDDGDAGFISEEVSSYVPPVINYGETVPEGRIVDYTVPETYEMLNYHMSKLAETYPELIKLSDIGTTHEGRAIKMLTLGTGSRKALVVGSMHAREHITVSYILRCIEEYALAYYSEDGMYDDFYSMKMLLEWYTLYIVPDCNPDGTESVISGAPVQFTSYKPFVLSQMKANALGVDLNRNFPFVWEGIANNIPAPNTYYFKGYSAGSEAETQALMNLCQTNDFYWMLSFHIQGNCVYWRDTTNYAVSEDVALVNRLAYICGFKICDVSSDPNSYGGGFENWFRSATGHPGMCVELISSNKSVYPTSDYNHKRFTSTLDFDRTKYAIIAAMYEYNKGETTLYR